MNPTRRHCLAGLLALLGVPARAQEQSFAQWLQGLRQDALKQGIAPATLDRALADVAPIPRILELDRRQPETTLTFDEYIERVVTPQRRDTARQRFAENRALLQDVGNRFGVQPRFIVALWGIETDFGRVTGSYPVIPALATLAYDGRRSAFFRRELMNALLIVDRQHIDPHRMMGSWAGAMGQSQFMPSSFLQYAVSYRGDAAPDIWSRRDDVFASIANYLSRVGWKSDQNWGESVSLPAGMTAPQSAGESRPMADWAKAGVRRIDGRTLAVRPINASLVAPGGTAGPSFLIYDNFRALLKWNNSTYFATAVGFLADSVDNS
jgi:membrane-bound lytic murein transglycosylase B